MSVICQNEYDAALKAFVKGSPEKIASLCREDTVPRDFAKVLTEYT